MMRKVAAISADLEKMAFNSTKIEAPFLYDASHAADILGRKLEELADIQ